MRIQNSNKNRNLLKTLFNTKKIDIFLIIILIFVLFFSGMFFGIIIYKDLKQKDAESVIKGVLKTKLLFIPHWIESINAKPEQIYIDIKHLDYQKLAYNREVALQRKQLFPDCRDEVPAKLTFKNKEYKIKMRLKGDFKDHWIDPDKWSFRIKIKGDNAILGMKEFSIQLPRTRGYLNEWVFHQFLKYNDFIALRYNFIQVHINGKDLGIYALEEHFDKRLIENNKRREGPVLKLSEQDFNIASIEIFQESELNNNKTLKENFEVAVNLLAEYKKGKLPINKVFEVKKLAELFAVTDLFGHHHAAGLWNIRFYYNPVISLLEPIGFDNQNILSLDNERLYIENFYDFIGTKNNDFRTRMINHTWYKILFGDTSFVKEYLIALNKYSNENLLNMFFSSIKDSMNNKLKILYKSFPWYSFNNEKKILYYNQFYIRKKLDAKNKLLVYTEKIDKNSIVLQIGNNGFLPLSIIGIEYKDSLIKPKRNTFINSQKMSEPVSFYSVEFDNKKKLNKENLKNCNVIYTVFGLDKIYKAKIKDFTIENRDFIQKDIMLQKSNVSKKSYLKIDNKNKRIYFDKDVEIKDNLIVPENYTVIVNPGTQINIINNAKIISRSSFVFNGNEDSPIIVQSTDSTGSIVIINSDNNIFQFTEFINLSNPKEYNWSLTGALTFYQSNVEFHSCIFNTNIMGDDFLNIIRSEFVLEKCVFENTKADAFDGDFVKGKIVDCYFNNPGNDAIDVSGSDIEILNTSIINPQDKGISAGEVSNIKCENIIIKNGEIAISSKDFSKVFISNIDIEGARIGYAIYQKKPEYQEAYCYVNNEKISGYEKHYMLEKGSYLSIDNKAIPPNFENVKEYLYGNEYGKSSGKK
ncbi:MAG: hypothetical protein QME48_04115 [bacterium]|nr:hypothetical protein [bacterium]